jgi:hypothetical protein
MSVRAARFPSRVAASQTTVVGGPAEEGRAEVGLASAEEGLEVEGEAARHRFPPLWNRLPARCSGHPRADFPIGSFLYWRLEEKNKDE